MRLISVLLFCLAMAEGCDCQPACAKVKTANFEIDVDGFAAEDANESLVGRWAERQRVEIARYWLGQPLRDWRGRVQVTIEADRQTSGATSFPRSEGVLPVRMVCRGPDIETIVSSVLPHEITHTVIHSRLGHQIPRWYDEGVASYCEAPEHRRLVVRHVADGRWDFRSILNAKEYPPDHGETLKLYGVGLLAVETLMEQGSPADLIRCGELGMSRGWDTAFRTVYDLDVDDVESRIRETSRERPQYHARTGTLYTAPYCEACERAKYDLQSDEFRALGIEWRILDISEIPRPSWAQGRQVGMPEFVVAGQRYGATHNGYSREALYSWLLTVVPPEPSDGIPTPEPQPPEPVPDPISNPTTPEPPPIAEPADPLVDINWSGIRFVVVLRDSPDLKLHIAGGVLRRTIEYISGAQATLEVIDQATAPERYQAVTSAGRFGETPIFGVVLVDEIAEVGFIKGRVLRRIISRVQESLNTESLSIPILDVFRRTSPKDYVAILAALDTPAPYAPTESTSLVALILGALGTFVGRRVWVYATQFIRAKKDAEDLDFEDSATAERPAPAPSTVESIPDLPTL